MDLARRRGCAPDGLIATTDADSRPAPDWLRAQLEAVGARRAGDRRPGRARRARPRAAAGRAARGARRDAAPPARGDSRGAGRPRAPPVLAAPRSAVTAATYARVGRLEPRDALEDEGFERALRAPRRADRPARRGARDHVRPARGPGAARPRGRPRSAPTGWPSRSYAAADFPLERLLGGQGPARSASSCRRATWRRRSARRARRDRAARDAGLVDELLVVDAASPTSRPRSRRRGARVVRESELLPGVRPRARQGRRDVARARPRRPATLVAFLDTDTEDFTPAFVLGLLGPLLTDATSRSSRALPAAAAASATACCPTAAAA